MHKKATVYYPKINIDIIKDKSDNKILELTISSKANYIITGNTNDFTMDHYDETLIVTPKEYWELHKPM